MLRSPRTQAPENHVRESNPWPISRQRNQKPKIQHYHLPPSGTLPTIQVFPKPLFSHHGNVSVRAGHSNKLLVHLLDPSGKCFNAAPLKPPPN